MNTSGLSIDPEMMTELKNKFSATTPMGEVQKQLSVLPEELRNLSNEQKKELAITLNLSWFERGRIEYAAKNRPVAKKCYEKALNTQLTPEEKARTLSMLSSISVVSGDYTQAVEYREQVLDISGEAPVVQESTIIALMNLGIVALKSGDKEKTKKYREQIVHKYNEDLIVDTIGTERSMQVAGRLREAGTTPR